MMQKYFPNYLNKKQIKSVIIKQFFLGYVLIFIWAVLQVQYNNIPFNKMKTSNSIDLSTHKEINDTATFGAGCFWCIEAIFSQLKGVVQVFPGYMGGKIKNPTYKEVCSGLTGHAEVVQIVYNSNVISYVELLEVFFLIHDPTTLNKQGADVGAQYRSVIFYHNSFQKEKAIFYKDLLNKSGAFDKEIVTEISESTNFYKAEDYHLNYYNINSKEPYCRAVIQPKLEKFKKAFADKLK